MTGLSKSWEGRPSVRPNAVTARALPDRWIAATCSSPLVRGEPRRKLHTHVPVQCLSRNRECEAPAERSCTPLPWKSLIGERWPARPRQEPRAPEELPGQTLSGPPRQLDQEHDGDREVDHQAGGIDEGADEGGGDDGGVDAQAAGDQGNEGADGVGPHADAQERQADDGRDAPGLAPIELGVEEAQRRRASGPGRSPVSHSRRSTRRASRPLISPRARPRMTVPTVWLPALPPVPSRSGRKNVERGDSDRRRSVHSNSVSTGYVKFSARKSISSHLIRRRTDARSRCSASRGPCRPRGRGRRRRT